MDIEEDTVWKKGDDLNFNGPVYIWSGATLTIEKGAVINFDEDPDGYATYLNVSGGRIVANGTQDEPIKITGR
ncbi:MAG TPA: hypothetical protein VK255_01900, partial [Patescibacteria group bacterium]|nr:hypothetical protein [Patescibacteria group bacterium]